MELPQGLAEAFSSLCTWKSHVSCSPSQVPTWECHVSEPSKPPKPPPPYRATWKPHVPGHPKTSIYMGSYVNFALFTSKPFPHGIPCENVAFRQFTLFSHVEAYFLWPLIWVSHVNRVQTARNMGTPCRENNGFAVTWDPMSYTRCMAEQHTIVM